MKFLIVRTVVGAAMIYWAVWGGSKVALAIILALTMLSCEALSYSVHGNSGEKR